MFGFLGAAVGFLDSVIYTSGEREDDRLAQEQLDYGQDQLALQHAQLAFDKQKLKVNAAQKAQGRKIMLLAVGILSVAGLTTALVVSD